MVNFLWWTTLIITLAATWFFQPRKRNGKGLLENLILFLTVGDIGFFGLIEAYQYISDPAPAVKALGSIVVHPLQYEIAMADVAFAVLGFLCYWDRGDFWLATILGNAIFSFGQGIAELSAYVRQGIGIDPETVFFRIAVPCITLAILLVYRHIQKKHIKRH